MKHLLALTIMFAVTHSCFGQVSLKDVTYTSDDSAKVVCLLTEGLKQPKETNFMLYYGLQFLDVPYVGHTLEVNKTERLVVNLQGLDCTTFVETVAALKLATEQGTPTFDAFCNQLQRIRYSGGHMDGYPSRNHYFTQWVASNESLGVVREISDSVAPFTALQIIDLHYMSRHPERYSMLKDNLEDQRAIRVNEQKVEGKRIRYIPKELIGGTKETLGMINDGDILALVTTKKDGLDTTHLGIAVWGEDGRLHLLNASSIYHRVVLDSNTLYTYQQRQTSQTGIRVVRVL